MENIEMPQKSVEVFIYVILIVSFGIAGTAIFLLGFINFGSPYGFAMIILGSITITLAFLSYIFLEEKMCELVF
jgi:hypothetical protein